MHSEGCYCLKALNREHGSRTCAACEIESTFASKRTYVKDLGHVHRLRYLKTFTRCLSVLKDEGDGRISFPNLCKTSPMHKKLEKQYLPLKTSQVTVDGHGLGSTVCDSSVWLNHFHGSTDIGDLSQRSKRLLDTIFTCT